MSTTWTSIASGSATVSTQQASENARDDAQKIATGAAGATQTLSSGSTTLSALHYADAASTSATTGATSATAAAASSTAAASSASGASTSATSAAASLAEFNGIYYGSSGTAPTTSIASGDIFFNSSSNQLQVYNGSTWQAGVTDTSGLQSADAGLTSISNLTTAADNMIYTTGSDAFAVTSLTAAGRALLDDADAAAQLTTLGAAPLASPTFTGTVIASNLTVNGTTVTNKATTVLYDDTILELNLDSGSAPSGTTTTDIGMGYHYYSGSAKTAFAGFVNATSEWTYIPDATLGSAVSGTPGTIKIGTVKFADSTTMSTASGHGLGSLIALGMG